MTLRIRLLDKEISVKATEKCRNIKKLVKNMQEYTTCFGNLNDKTIAGSWSCKIKIERPILTFLIKWILKFVKALFMINC